MAQVSVVATDLVRVLGERSAADGAVEAPTAPTLIAAQGCSAHAHV